MRTRARAHSQLSQLSDLSFADLYVTGTEAIAQKLSESVQLSESAQGLGEDQSPSLQTRFKVTLKFHHKAWGCGLGLGLGLGLG